MKFFLQLFIFTLLCSYKIQAQTINTEITNDGSPYLLGKIDKKGLTSPNYNTWFSKGYNDYQPDKILTNKISKQLKEYHILVFLGTWCGDSRREVPRLYKVLETAKYPMQQLTVVALSGKPKMYKQSPNHEEKGLHIKRVPTIIFYKNEKEVNRIVESPVESLEQDMLAIFKGDYMPNYSLDIKKVSKELLINRYIRLPKNARQAKQLLVDLNAFLKAAQKDNKANKYVLPTEKIETDILVDEFKKITNISKQKNFFKPHLLSVVPLNKNDYLLKIAYMGAKDSVPLVRAIFELIAYKQQNSFLFASPLKRNTVYWKSKAIGSVLFYYKDKLVSKNAEEYARLIAKFDKKLGSKTNITEFYCAENTPELLKLIGVDYKLDYNGRSMGSFFSIDNNKELIVSGRSASFNNFDPHDLWHDRLSLVISRRLVNRPVDEACAYLYGGSWGMTWQEILKRFMDKIAIDKKVDWKNYKENPTDFGVDSSKHLYVDYVVNALLIKKIEKEKGFAGVWKLLNSGKFEKGNENYYKVLNDVIGISKKNYNRQVWKLIRQEKKNFK